MIILDFIYLPLQDLYLAFHIFCLFLLLLLWNLLIFVSLINLLSNRFQLQQLSLLLLQIVLYLILSFSLFLIILLFVREISPEPSEILFYHLWRVLQILKQLLVPEFLQFNLNAALHGFRLLYIFYFLLNFYVGYQPL